MFITVVMAIIAINKNNKCPDNKVIKDHVNKKLCCWCRGGAYRRKHIGITKPWYNRKQTYIHGKLIFYSQSIPKVTGPGSTIDTGQEFKYTTLKSKNTSVIRGTPCMLSDNKDTQNISSYSRSKNQFKQCTNDSPHIFKLKN